MAYLVFDIGGTSTRGGVYEPRSRELVRWERRGTPNFLTAPSASFDELRGSLLDAMSEIASSLGAAGRVDGVSVAFAGPIDAEGRVVAAPTIWGDRQTAPRRFQDEVEARLGQRVRILNDVTAAGFRYLRSPDEDFCIVTVSSGIGNKVFCGGRPLLGPRGAGGELGHLRVDDSADAVRCDCGGRGHLGAIASGRGAVELARRSGHPADSRAIVAGFRRREAWATSVIDECARQLGRALAALHLGIGIERFVLVGGFALTLGEPYRAAVARAAAERCWSDAQSFCGRVELGIDDDLSGLIGAGIAVSRGEAR